MAWKNPWYNPQLAHHRPHGFCNPGKPERTKDEVRRWYRERKEQGLPLPPKAGYPAFIRQWWQSACFEQQGEQGAWWLGHASVLLRVNGRLLLTDPVFSQRASPLSFVGPKRKTPLPFALDDLPAPDAVLISHNHYDHLDWRTIRYLHRRFPGLAFFVPLGLKRAFSRRGINEVTELDWWQSVRWQGLGLHCVPAQHWSRRGLWDTNRTLWCGWLVKSERLSFWFSGDTGYSEVLLEIPQRLGSINAAAIPIGAYQPRWFMGLHHMAPEQAVQLWRQFGCPPSIPIHWGVFELTDEGLDCPVAQLQAALQQPILTPGGLPASGRFSPLKIGGYLSLDPL